MSKAGIHSNRGDDYQILVAMDWAINVLLDVKYDWIEVDSVLPGKSGSAIEVDDVVVGSGEQVLVCCQTKKNSPGHTNWTVAELSDDLNKALTLFATNTSAGIRFCSRSPFGELKVLHEHAQVHVSFTSYFQALTVNQRGTHDKLLALSDVMTDKDVHFFLRSAVFEVTGETDQLEAKLRQRLGLIVSNHEEIFNALYRELDRVAKRKPSNERSSLGVDRLSKANLREIVRTTGGVLSAPVDEKALRQRLRVVSMVGRAWRRDAGGHRIVLPATTALIEAVANESQKILLTGIPGGGKTCALLDFVEHIEQQTDTTIVFVQAREYASLPSYEEREAHGLPREFCSLVARLADLQRVVVVIDSLDVLSISREGAALSHFLSLIDQLALIPRVTVVAACREFDLKYDQRLANLSWSKTVRCDELDWLTCVVPLLSNLAIDCETIDAETRHLICTPLDLALFVEIAKKVSVASFSTRQMLVHRYLDVVLQRDTAIGDAGVRALELIAVAMLRKRELVVARNEICADEQLLRKLQSAGVLEPDERDRLRFRHQTLLDTLIVSDAMRKQQSLKTLVDQLAPLPFVRPVIRSYVFVVSATSRIELRKNIRAIVVGSAAYHIKRLVVECLAELVPDHEDWSLVKWLFDRHRELFHSLYLKLSSFAWYSFMCKNYQSYVVQKQDVSALASHARWIAQWKEQDADSVVRFWCDALEMEWSNDSQLAWMVSIELPKMQVKDPVIVTRIVELLLAKPVGDRDFLGHVLAYGVRLRAVGDDTLWRYITSRIKPEDLSKCSFRGKLNCEPHDFGNDKKFFEERMCASDSLLSLAIGDIERWSEKCRWTDSESGWCDVFLDDTSYRLSHSKHDMYHVGAMNELFRVVGNAVETHALTKSEWWTRNAERLTSSREGALRYIALRAITKHVELNIDHAERVLRDSTMPYSSLSFEFAELCSRAIVLVGNATHDFLEQGIVRRWLACPLPERMYSARRCAALARAIPAYMRSERLSEMLKCWENKFGPTIGEPAIRSRGGMVHPPFSHEVFLRVSDFGVLRLLAHYESDNEWSTHEENRLVGGAEQVERVLNEASSRDPERFMNLLVSHWTLIPDRYRKEILEGAANHIAYLGGRLQPQQGWEPLHRPNLNALALQLLDELDRHPTFWRERREAAKAISACAHVVINESDRYRVLFLAIGFASLVEAYDQDETALNGLMATGINMTRGEAVQAALTLMHRTIDEKAPWPELLMPAIKRFALDPNPAVKSLVLHELSNLQWHYPEEGWNLFRVATADAEEELWCEAEKCLYWSYNKNFQRVDTYLSHIGQTFTGEAAKMWGRISSLAVLEGHIRAENFVDQLRVAQSLNKWLGATQVWTSNAYTKKCTAVCWFGIRAAFSSEFGESQELLAEMRSLFKKCRDLTPMPDDIVEAYFATLEKSEAGRDNFSLHGIDDWLGELVVNYPDEALQSSERVVAFLKLKKTPHVYMDELPQVLTRLFREAEERELSDGGAMLGRCITLQDGFLSLGLQNVEAWLFDAERP